MHKQSQHPWPGCRFDVITDKGTLDAVGLMADADKNRCSNMLFVPALSSKVPVSCNSSPVETRRATKSGKVTISLLLQG